MARTHYRERLVPGPLTWIVVGSFIAMLAIAYGAALGSAVGWWAGIGLGVIVGIAMWWGSPIIVVDDRGLSVGTATLPASAIGAVHPVEPADVRSARDADARAFVLVRPMTARAAVAVDVHDPADPHPQWIVSSRRPQELASSVQRIRTEEKP